MSIRVAINGFGRIGRLVLRAAKQSQSSDLDFVAVNDLTSNQTLAHLLKYDSVHGSYPGEVVATPDGLRVDADEIQVLSETNPSELPWGDLGVDIVVEATGRFTNRDDAVRHLAAGARKVIISAPAKNEDITVVMGVNERRYDPEAHHVISNASCTTNCLAPVVKVVLEHFGLVRGWMTTVHAYTNDQTTLDAPHKDLRRARAAAVSMIPTTTGAARATALVLPQVEGKLDGMAIRVPTPNVSLIDLTAQVARDTTVEEVNRTFVEAAEGELKGILGVSPEPLVSVDFIGNPLSSVVDLGSTFVIDGRLVKVLSWYDNEWGYSCRVLDLVQYVGARLPSAKPG